MALKLLLSAFEYAWAPFYYADDEASRTRKRDVPRWSRPTASPCLALLTPGWPRSAATIVRCVDAAGSSTAPPRVVPWTALGVFFHGVYLLTSIGLNITKRTRYYPVATVAAAATQHRRSTSLLIPRYGIIGAAWANAAAYGVQAGDRVSCSRSGSTRSATNGAGWRGSASPASIAYAAAWALPAMPPLAGVLAARRDGRRGHVPRAARRARLLRRRRAADAAAGSLERAGAPAGAAPGTDRAGRRDRRRRRSPTTRRRSPWSALTHGRRRGSRCCSAICVALR